MELYKQERVFNTDVLKPGLYIAFREHWVDEDYKKGIIVNSNKTEIKVAVYDNFSKNENKLDIYTIKVDCTYEILPYVDQYFKEVQ